MIITEKLISIGIILVSIGIGLISFYILSDLNNSEKKKYMEAISSQIVNFILFIWISKVILNLELFIQDPLSILAYPAGSDSVYLSVLFTVTAIMINVTRDRFKLLTFAQILTQVMLVGLFVYEFIQMIFEDNPYSFAYLVLIFILLTIFFMTQDKIKSSNLLLIILTIWTVGLLMIDFIHPYVAIFGYLIEVWFIIGFFICGLLILALYKREEI